MKNIILAVLVGGFISMSLNALAEGDANPEQIKTQMQELQNKRKELQKELNKIARKINLHKDPEIVALKKQLKEKMDEKIGADPDGKQILNSLNDLNKQFQELRKQMKPTKKGKTKPKKKKQK